MHQTERIIRGITGMRKNLSKKRERPKGRNHGNG